MKKIISVILILAVIITCMPVLALDASSTFILSDFNGSGGANTPSTGEINEEIHLLEDVSWKFSKSLADGKTNMKVDFGRADISQYSYFNLLVYSEQAYDDASYMIRFGTTLENKSNKKCYLYYTFAVNWSGWKLLTISTASFEKKYQATTDDDYWAKTDKTFGIYHSYGNDVYCADEVPIYVDRAWMSENVPPVLYQTAQNKEDTPITLYDSLVKINFSNTLNKVLDESLITVKVGEELIAPSNYTLGIDGASLCLTFKENCMPTEEFNVFVEAGAVADEYGQILTGSKKYCYKIVGDELFVKNLTFDKESVQDGVMAAASCEAVNRSEEDATVMLVAGLYHSKTGAMKDCVINKQEVEKGKSKTLVAPINGIKDCVLKAFVFVMYENSNFVPMVEDIPILGSTDDVLAADFAKARQAIKTNLVGANNDMNNQYVSKKIKEFEEAAEESQALMNRAADAKTLWGTYSTKNSDFINENFKNIFNLAKAYSAIGSKYYKNQDMLKDIIYGLEFMSENLYTQQLANSFGNWWQWMIGAPRNQLKTIACIYDDLTEEQILKYTETIHTIMPSMRYTGGNAAWSAYIVILTGILRNDEQSVRNVVNETSRFWNYGEDSTAIYYDGSIVEHKYFPYNGGYGTNLICDLSEAILCLAGTDFFPKDPNVSMQIHWLKKCFEPFIYDGLQVQSVTGRNIAKGGKVASGIVEGMLYMLHYAKPEDVGYLKSLIKYHAEQYGSGIYNEVALGEVENLKNIIEDDSIKPRENYEFSQVFFNMDRIMHYGNDFAFSIAMSSERIKRYECLSGDNQEGWYTGDGMVYTLYHNDYVQNGNHYYWDLDYTRVPGTTTDKQPREASSVSTDNSDNAIYDFVGGASLNNKYTVAAMDFGGANEPARSYTASGVTYETKKISSDLTAKKSWFMFEDEMVALGCDITSTEDPGVETTIDNRLLWDPVEKNTVPTVMANGGALPRTINNQSFDSLSWATIEGVGGYVFPYKDGMNITTYVNEKYGTEFVEIYKNHGINPNGASYAYISLPNKTEAETKAYSENPAVEILANNGSIQAVKKASSGVTQAIFRTAGTLGALTVNIPCAVVMRETEDLIELAVSDPTQKLTSGKLTINTTGLSLKTADKGVSITGGGSEPIEIDLNFNESPDSGYVGDSYKGITYTIVLRKD